MSKSKILCAALIAAAAGTLPLAAQAQESPWMVRVRALHLDSANKDGTGLGLAINDKWMPDVDVTYFFSPQLSAELVLTYPQKHTLHSDALGVDLGTLKHLPPTLTAQYRFTGLGAFTPYVGAGVNYTRFSSVKLSALGGTNNVHVDRNSFGLAVQLGVDIPLTKNLSLNLDVKKVQIRTDVSEDTLGEVGRFKVDPLLVGVGLGWRF